MKVIDYALMPQPRVDFDPAATPITLVTDQNHLDRLAAAIPGADRVAVDTETHAAHVLRNGLWGAVRTIQVALRTLTADGYEYSAYVIDVRDLDVAEVAKVMASIPLARGWNANFDEEVLEIYGAPIKKWRDTMLDDAVLWSGMPGRSFYLGLAVATQRYLGLSVEGKGTVQTSFDGTSDLTDDQVTYAAYDAIVTMAVSEDVERLLDEHEVRRAADITQGARPFAVMLMRNGYPFDMEGWVAYLETRKEATGQALADMARLTAGNRRRVDGEWVYDRTPNWNPSSSDDLKAMLNEHAAGYIHELLGHPMGPADSTDKATMKQLSNLGCELADAVLAYRAGAKIDEAFGEKSLSKSFWDGRIHPTYRQALTSTGRWSSQGPNGQNQPGSTKIFQRPGEGRVIVQADYAGAELRVLGTLAQEPVWLDVFLSGGDLHAENAKRMFNVDYDGLLETDPKAAKKVRHKAKTTGFGMPYNMGAGLLARTLSNEGVETSFAEAKKIIDSYYEVNAMVGEYLKARDAFVESIAADPGAVDWALSFKLLDLFLRLDAPRRAFKRKNKRFPTAEELADIAMPETEQLDLFAAVQSDEDRAAEKAELVADIEWAFRYDAPVVLRPGGDPLAWESRTMAGRRRIFAVPMAAGFQRSEKEDGSGSDTSDKFSGVVTSAMLTAAATNKPGPARLRDEWAQANNVKLPAGIDRCARLEGESPKEYRERSRQFQMEERKRCVKAFEGDKRKLMPDFVRFICDAMGPQATEYLLTQALSDQIRKLIGAFRNHPIQGTVADIAEAAFARLMDLREEFPDLVWIQTVHDSIVGECDEANGVEIATRQKRIMEEVMAEIVPGIPAKADAEVGTSVAEDDIIVKIPDFEPVAA